MTDSPIALLTSPAARRSYAHASPMLARLREAGHEAWLVGGGVRDLLLGRPVADWDIATSALPEAVLALWDHAVPTGLRHGTVTVPTEGGPVEITTYRADGPYTDGRHPDWVRFGVRLEDDLARRDFTVNAMALDPVDGRFEDPFHGRADLAAACLRTVGDADLRFSEDGLRPLRGARLAAVLEFTLDAEAREAMARARDGVARVARERVRDEMRKLLAAPRPSVGLEILRDTGLLAAILPELLEGVGMEQNRHHAHDIWWHTLHTVDAAPPDRPVVRLAALLHDVGKPRTRRVVDGEGTFYGHQQVGARMARAMLERLRFSRDDAERVAHLVEEHMFQYEPEWTDAAVRRFIGRVGVDHLEDLFALRRADSRGNGRKRDDPAELDELCARIASVLRRDDALSIEALDVTGEDIMAALGIPEGPEVGRVLRGLLDRVLEDPELNHRESLLALARDIHPAS